MVTPLDIGTSHWKSYDPIKLAAPVHDGTFTEQIQKLLNWRMESVQWGRESGEAERGMVSDFWTLAQVANILK